jgi:malonyl-CoA/methylmalonyl-CoA synthetase
MTDLSETLRQALTVDPARPALESLDADGVREILCYGALSSMAEDKAGALLADGLRRFEPVLVPVSNRAEDLGDLIAVWLAEGVAVPIHRATPPGVRAALEARLCNRFALDRAVDQAFLPPERPLLEGASTIVFTSGSTGEPKGVVLRADRQADKLAMIGRQTGWRDGLRTLLALQLTFSFGQWVSLLTLISGGTLVLPDRLSADGVSAALRAGGIDRLPTVPTLLRALIARPELAGHAPGAVMTGGEVLPAALGRAIRAFWPEAALSDIYGLSETGTCDFFVDGHEYDAAAGSIGRPGEGIAVRLDPDGGLRIKSPWAMAGYLDNPDATARAFDADGYFQTGDLAEVDSAGRYRLIGRAKELINRAGLKVAPLEVEAVLAEHPSVAACLISGATDAATGERVVGCVVPQGSVDEALLAGQLTSWLAERIERYKVPSEILVLDALPTGRTGKADRGALRRLFDRP